MTSRRWRYYKLSSRNKRRKSLDSWTSSGMERRALRSIHSRRLVRCLRVKVKRDRWHQPCSSRYCSSLVLRMRSCKDLKKAICSLFSWDKCQLMIFRKLSLIRTTSSSLNRDKWPKTLSKTQQATQLSQTTQLWPNSKWTDYNTFNMNALRLSWKRNMKSELISSTAGLRRDKLSKVLIKMLTWYWCRIAWERPNRKQRLSEVERVISHPRKTSTSQG